MHVFLHLKQNQSPSEQMVEAFLLQETRNLSTAFNSQQWECIQLHPNPVPTTVSLQEIGELQIVREDSYSFHIYFI